MTSGGRTTLACAALLVAAVASTATIDSLAVDKKGKRYSLHAETFLNAPPQAIYDVLLDYERFGRISSVYKEYGYLEPLPDGTPIVYTRMEGCLLGFCKSMMRVERLESEAPGHIRTETLPERSDFKSSVSQWVLKADGDGTRMTYTLEMEPDFFVPPVIGPWLLKRTLKRGGGRAIERIERLAQGIPAEQDVPAEQGI